MRDAGLLQIQIEIRSGVGRPQHLYSLADDAPSLGLEPPTFPMLARMLLTLARRGALGGDEAAEVGREQGRADALLHADDASCLEAVVTQLFSMGFDPAIGGGGGGGAPPG